MTSHIHQKSWLSYSHTRSLSSAMDINNYSDEELLKQVEKLKINNKRLATENEILENTVKRLDPSLMNGIQQAIEIALRRSKSRSSMSLGQTSKIFSDGLSRSAFTSGISSVKFPPKRRSDASAIFGISTKLNINERSELATTETQILMEKIIAIKKGSEKRHELFKAKLEQITMRNDAVEKAIVSFNQQVVIDGWDNITNRIPAEVWLRYMNEWNSKCDKEINKLRLRTSATLARHNKLKGQIATKGELSQNLVPIDFEKMNIEVQILLKTLDKRLEQCNIVKNMLGEANLNLAVHRKALLDQNNYLTTVQKEIHYRRTHIPQLMRKARAMEENTEMWEIALDDIKKAINVYESPDLMGYIGLKEEITNLNRSIKVLEHKLRIYRNMSKAVESMDVV